MDTVEELCVCSVNGMFVSDIAVVYSGEDNYMHLLYHYRQMKRSIDKKGQ